MNKLGDYVQVRGWGLMVAAVALLLDVVSKGEILQALVVGRLPWWLVEGQWGFAFAWNRGMSFSLLQDAVWGPWFLAGVAVLACGWFVHWMKDGGWWHEAGLGLIVGGAVGNLLDRVQHGAVVDFVVANPWGFFPYTFNVADACITVGVGVLLLDGFLTKKNMTNNGKAGR